MYTVTGDCFVFFPTDSQYQSQFDNNQTEVDSLITSEEVTKENSESNINYPNIKTQQNFIASAWQCLFHHEKKKISHLLLPSFSQGL